MLFKVSFVVRWLYLRYAESAVPVILARIPAPVSALLQISWDLESMHDNEFDHVSTLELLRQLGLMK